MELPTPPAALHLLGLSTPFDSGDVKRAFHTLARTLHPDKNPSPNATAEFQNLTDCRDVLYAVLDHGGGGSAAASPPRPGSSRGATAEPPHPEDVYDGSRCPCCDIPVAPPPVRHPFFRCPNCEAILRHPNPAAEDAAPVHIRADDMVAAPEEFLRRFTGSVDLRRTTLEEKNIAVVWRCLSCPRSDQSVCCRVKERRGECLHCGHKLADHRAKAGSSSAGRGGGRRKFSCTKPKCPCRTFAYHVRQGGWQLRCSCKHKHTDHDPGTGVCTKMIPGRKPCPCRAFDAAWVCNCGHQWNCHETAFVELPGGVDGDAAKRSDFMSREWVAGGVRPEIREEAATKRAKWAARGHAPSGASDAARAMVQRAVPMGVPAGGSSNSGGGGSSVPPRMLVGAGGSGAERISRSGSGSSSGSVAAAAARPSAKQMKAARQALLRIYDENAPERSATVNRVMNGWLAKGRPLNELVQKVRAKYT